MLLWRAVFVHVGSAYRHYMIGGVFGVVKGGFSRIRRRIQDGGIPAYAGMTGGVWDMTGWGRDTMGWGDGNGGTQRRKGAMKSRRGRRVMERFPTQWVALPRRRCS